MSYSNCHEVASKRFIKANHYKTMALLRVVCEDKIDLHSDYGKSTVGDNNVEVVIYQYHNAI
jgi:hypothetical protein